MLRTALLVGLVLLVIQDAAFAGVPEFVTYSGRLTDGTGEGESLQLDLTLRLHDDAVMGDVVWEQEFPGVMVVDGYFTVVLEQGVAPGDGLPVHVAEVALVHDGLWLSVAIEGAAPSSPGTPLSSTPFALRAGLADEVREGAIGEVHVAPGFGLVPAGAILMWSGATTQIPPGWALCDGSNGTPDLRDRFIVGAGAAYALGVTGGAATVPHTHSVGNHSHGVSTHSHSLPAHQHGTPNHKHLVLYKSGTDPGTIHTGDGTLVISWGSQGPAGPPDQTYHITAPSSFWGYSDTSGGGVTGSGGDGSTGGSGALSTSSNGAATTSGASAEENRPPYYALAYIMRL